MGPHSKQGHDVCPEISLVSFMSADGDSAVKAQVLLWWVTTQAQDSSSSFCLWDHPSGLGQVDKSEWCVPETSSEWGRPLSPDALTMRSLGHFRWGHLNRILTTLALGHFWWSHLSSILTIPPWRPLGWGHPTRNISCLMYLRLLYMLIKSDASASQLLIHVFFGSKY